MLRHLSVDGNTPEFVDASMMARAAAKVESMEDTIASLHRSLSSLHDDGGYFGSHLDRPADFDQAWMRSGCLVGRLAKDDICTAKPIVAARLDFPKSPSFDPVPFFDAGTSQAYLFPLDQAVDHRLYGGEVPRVSVHASSVEKVALYKKLFSCGRLREVDGHLARDPFISGLFSVNKSSTMDRLILDARPPNLLEGGRNYWCGTMASATSLGDIYLEQGVDLCSSGLDLKDFFYQFQVSEQRIIRNTLAGSVTRSEAEEIFGPKEGRPAEVRVALATLAMGDLLACEFSQEAHLSLCLRYHVAFPGELLTLRTPVPRSSTIAGVIIDDLVVMEKLCRSDYTSRPLGPDGYNQRIKNALDAYDENDLAANIKKSFFNESCARYWGCEIDGAKGLVRSSTLRAWPLVVITMRVAMLGFSSIKLLETLAGSWISVLTMRRRMFCLLDIIFEALAVDDPCAIIALSPELQDEFSVLAFTFLLARGDLRAPFLPFISATDASNDAMAGARAPLDSAIVCECSRFSLKKSTWSRLLPPGKAILREKALLEPEDELPGIGICSHPLWSILAGALDYKAQWVTKVSSSSHINLLELKAFMIEEQKISSSVTGRRCLSGLDSQVCLGALTKGRSSSPAINNSLQRGLCYPLGSGLYNYYMYYLSEENRADGPSRGRPPDPPSLDTPSWLLDLAEEKFEGFDEWISSLSAEFQLQPFDFSFLDNGDHLDLRPAASLPSRSRRRANQKIHCSTKKPISTTKTDDATLSSTTPGALPSSCVPDALVNSSSLSGIPSGSEAEVRKPSIKKEFGSMLSKADDSKKAPADGPEAMKYGALLEHFSLDQFVYKGSVLDLNLQGGLDLFSGSMGVAKQMIQAGAPWVLTFDWDRSPKEDLLQQSLRDLLVWFLEDGFFRTLSLAPICASFSKAVTPPVRSKQYPRGKPGISRQMRRKVSDGNSHADFCLLLIGICITRSISFFLENPDSSWLWQLKGYEQCRDPASGDIFRLCFCRFGTSWRKATRIYTSSRLRGLRMMCTCRGRHFPLRGFSSLRKKMWTKVAEPYPRGLARLLAISLCCQAGWCEQKKLNVGGCCRAGSLRIGEASHPGPARRAAPMRTTLESMPLLSAHTQELEARQLRLFVDWCSTSLRTSSPSQVFDRVPSFGGHCLRSYGDYLFQNGGALSNFRHCILAFQRWKPLCRPFLENAWEIVRRWEMQQPVSHRPPLPEGIVKSFVTLGWQHGWFEWCGVTLLSFYGAGRLGEVLRCVRGDLVLPCDTVGEVEANAFLELHRFKSLYRQSSKVQHMRIDDTVAVRLLSKIYGNYLAGGLLFAGSANQYRKRWDFLVGCFEIPKSLRLTPGGLRGGSAVAAYRRGVAVTTIQWNLRLRHLSTLENYIQETASLSIYAVLPSSSRTKLQQVSLLFPLLCYAANHQDDAAAS